MSGNMELHRAGCVNGQSFAKISSEIGVTTQTLWTYFAGKCLVPVRRREALERALGTVVDWFAYESEFNGTPAPQEPPEAPETPSVANPPLEPPETPQEPPAAKAGGYWADAFGDETLAV